MTSHPIGFETLLEIRYDGISVSFSSLAAAPSFPGVCYNDVNSCITFRCPLGSDPQLLICGKTVPLDIKSTATSFLCSARVPPLFFEERDYSFHFESSNAKEELGFWHENPYLRNAVRKTSSLWPIWDGIINFGSDIGFSDFVITRSERPLVAFTIEVFPAKLDYKEDYQALMEDVTNEIYALAFDFLKKTYRPFRLDNHPASSLVEFLAVLNKVYSRFTKALDVILLEPHHLLSKVHEVVPGYRNGGIDARSRSWLVDHPEHIRKNGGRFEADKYLSVKRPVTFDTKENRLAKAMVQKIIKRIHQLQLNCQAIGKEDGSGIKEAIGCMESGLRRRLNTPLFYAISSSTASMSSSMVFTMAPGYRELYRYYRMLMKGLSIQGGCFNLSEKNLATLYEYWCFVKLNQILRQKYSLISQDFIQAKANGLFCYAGQ